MFENPIVYSHWSAAIRWDIPFFKSVFSEELSKVGKEDDREHIVVFDSEDKFSKEGYMVHCCSNAIAYEKTSIVRGESLVRLELLFIQLASELGVLKTIMLGMLMCSKPNANPFMMTVEQLKHFALQAHGMHGRKVALRALKYIKEGCRSPQEAIIFMMLNNPYALGGFNLGYAVFDHLVVLPRKYEAHINEASYNLDIYYPSKKLDVEYQGAFHKDKTLEDMKRAEVLEEMGFKVIFLYTEDLYNLEKFYHKVEDIRKYLGKRIRIQSRHYAKNFSALRSLLPRLKFNDEHNSRSLGARRKEEYLFLRKYLDDDLLQLIVDTKTD